MNRLSLILLGLIFPFASQAQIRPSLDSTAILIQTGHKEYLSHSWQRVYGEPFFWLEYAQQGLTNQSGALAIPFPYSPENFSLPINQAVWPHGTQLRAQGSWTYSNAPEQTPSIPISWTGTALSATDPNAKLYLKLPDHPVRERLHLWLSQAGTSFDVALISGADTQWLRPSAFPDQQLLWLEFPKAVSLHNAHLAFQASQANQSHFNIHSIMSSGETSNDGYWLHCGQPNMSMSSLIRQLQTPIPEQTRLVILELGAHEIRTDNGLQGALNQWKSSARQIITAVQHQAPEADIILISPMAQLRGGYPNPASQTWSYALRELAEELDCGFFDWFRISGGLWAMQDWIDAEWAEYDGQFLSPYGQLIKTQCWWSAWNRSMNAPGPEIWVPDAPSYQANPRKPVAVNSEDPEPSIQTISPPAEPFLPSFHTVSPGETLYSISKRYGCSVAQLQAINGMGQSTQIRIGQKLRVPKP